MDKLDELTNEIEQGFMQSGGWEACRFLLGKLVANKDIEIKRLQNELTGFEAGAQVEAWAGDEARAEVTQLQNNIKKLKQIKKQQTEIEWLQKIILDVADNLKTYGGQIVFWGDKEYRIFISEVVKIREINGIS